MTTLTLDLETKAGLYTFDVEVTGDVSRGGSNAYGSDEPAWIDVDNVEIVPADHKRLGKRTLAKLEADHWDLICEAIINADGW